MEPPLDTLIDHLFRHRAGQMVATLARLFGAEHLSLAEEVVQEALITAMQQWSFHGVPDNPEGWLYRVAKNRALDQIRRQSALREKEPEIAATFHARAGDRDTATFAHELRDDTLRLMLLCCHPAIPPESRIALTLKTAGGFGVDEIARALLTKREAVAQRLVRAKRLIRDEKLALELPSRDELPARLESLLTVLYLIFNEGYAASAGEDLVRTDLAGEAIVLLRNVVEHPVATSPEARALLALMLLHGARLPARVDAAGELALLADQDRSSWNAAMIADGVRELERAMTGDRVTAYHVEATIAACHATAPSFDETDWTAIVELYDDLLELRADSPVVALNRAVAIAIARGPGEGIAEAERLGASLRDYLPLEATLAELSLLAGDPTRASAHLTRALQLPATLPQKRFLLRKLETCRSRPL